jgi:PAS domain-containing protein
MDREPPAAPRQPVAWDEEIPVAITVTDADGVIVRMNARARETFAQDGGGALVGRSVLDCHPEAAREKVRALLEGQRPNHYTISKGGQRKIIHQLPWFRDGRYAGLVEIAVPIPGELPHFDRG